MWLVPIVLLVFAWWAVARIRHDAYLWGAGHHTLGRAAWLAWHTTALVLVAVLAFTLGLTGR